MEEREAPLFGWRRSTALKETGSALGGGRDELSRAPFNRIRQALGRPEVSGALCVLQRNSRPILENLGLR